MAREGLDPLMLLWHHLGLFLDPNATCLLVPGQCWCLDPGGLMTAG